MDDIIENELYLGFRNYFNTTHKDCVWRNAIKDHKLCTDEVKIWLYSNGSEELVRIVAPFLSHYLTFSLGFSLSFLFSFSVFIFYSLSLSTSLYLSPSLHLSISTSLSIFFSMFLYLYYNSRYFFLYRFFAPFIVKAAFLLCIKRFVVHISPFLPYIMSNTFPKEERKNFNN